VFDNWACADRFGEVAVSHELSPSNRRRRPL